MEGNMVRLMRRCQLAKSTKEAARALDGKVRIIQDDEMPTVTKTISWNLACLEKPG